MEQPGQHQLTQMVNHTMVFIARCFLIPATSQFVVITRYYASLRLAGNKNQRILNPIQLRFLGSMNLQINRLEMAQIQKGNHVVVLQSGAYGLTANPAFFLSHPKLLEVLV